MSTGKKILAEITVKDGKPAVQIHNNREYEVVPLEGVTYIVERKSQDWCNLPEKIIQAAERLRGVQIENKPAVELIRRFNHPNVLIYCDPPYVLGTRHGKQYRVEMNDSDHTELLEVLKAHKGPVLISGYESKIYNDILQGWYREETTCYSQVCSKKKEILWMNYRPFGQISIFDIPEVIPGEN